MDLRIEGFAIVSRDGMLAGADGLMPNSLKFDGDQEFLDKSLDAAALLVHGRMSHEEQPNSCSRARLLADPPRRSVLVASRPSPMSGFGTPRRRRFAKFARRWG